MKSKQRRTPATSAPSLRRRPSRSSAPARPLVLLVDDQSTFRLLVRPILEEHAGVRVVEADTSERALELARRRRFDLVISDITHPRMNGLELVKVLRQEHPGVPVMIVSGSLNEAVWRRADRLDACCGLAKPFNVKTFLNAVADVLKGSIRGRPSRASGRKRRMASS